MSRRISISPDQRPGFETISKSDGVTRGQAADLKSAVREDILRQKLWFLHSKLDEAFAAGDAQAEQRLSDQIQALTLELAAVSGVDTVLKSADFQRPQTTGELAADSAAQAADRARQRRKEALQRKLVFLQTRLEEAWVLGDTQAEKRLSDQIEQTELALGVEVDMTTSPVAALTKEEAPNQPMADSYLAGLGKEDEVRKDENGVDLSDPLSLRGDSFGVRR